MLGIQLEDRALFLERWRDLLLETLAKPAAALGHQTGPRARVPGACRPRMDGPGVDRLGRVSAGEGVPDHLRPPRDDVADRAGARGRSRRLITRACCGAKDRCGRSSPSARCTCSIRNTRTGTRRSLQRWMPRSRSSPTAAERSPIARGAKPTRRNPPSARRRRYPFFGQLSEYARRSAARRRLHTSREHASHGPSERMAVSPGRESEGILHVPTGRAATRSHRITAINTARGSLANRHRSCRDHHSPPSCLIHANERHQSPRLPEN